MGLPGPPPLSAMVMSALLAAATVCHAVFGFGGGAASGAAWVGFEHPLTTVSATSPTAAIIFMVINPSNPGTYTKS